MYRVFFTCSLQHNLRRLSPVFDIDYRYFNRKKRRSFVISDSLAAGTNITRKFFSAGTHIFARKAHNADELFLIYFIQFTLHSLIYVVYFT